jgi:hypothetical protein
MPLTLFDKSFTLVLYALILAHAFVPGGDKDMADTARLYTEDDLLRLPKDGCKYELVKGELRLSPAGLRHEKIGMKLGQLLLNFAEQHQLGDV